MTEMAWEKFINRNKVKKSGLLLIFEAACYTCKESKWLKTDQTVFFCES